MEAKLYAALYQLVFSIAHPPRQREQFCDRWVAMVYLWSAIWGRPVSWACKTENWPASLDRPLISQSRMSRRLRTVGVSQLFERLLAMVSQQSGTPMVKQVGSKPLLVGAYSKDVWMPSEGVWPTDSSPEATGCTRCRTAAFSGNS
jgi:hypothetical protein